MIIISFLSAFKINYKKLFIKYLKQKKTKAKDMWRRGLVGLLLWIVLAPAVVVIQPITQQVIYFSYLFEHCIPT